jgi:hypothetical protein
MRTVCLWIFGVVMVASALVSAYHVDPLTAVMSAKARPDLGVSQIITCDFDELDSASGGYVELFAGFHGAGGGYHLSIYEHPDGALVAYRNNVIPEKDHAWLKFDRIRMEPGETFTKGKQYEFRFTRSGTDSIQYYYQDENPYQYGYMRVGGAEETGKDLCCRVYGRMKAVDDRWQACVGNSPDGSKGDTALNKAESIGIKWLRDDFEKMHTWVQNTHPGMEVYRQYNDNFSMTGILCYGTEDPTRSSRGRGTSWPAWYPPQNLYDDVNSDSNWWAGYCRSIMNSMPSVKHWEVWPEANAFWCWQDPDTFYRDGSGGLIDTPRERCSLYVRMCQVAKSTAHALGGGREVIGGATYRLLDGNESHTVSPGADWLRDMFDLAEHRYGGVGSCFDIVSVHPYMWYETESNFLVEDRFRIDLDTARAIMRAAGYPGMELWATEYGWPRWSSSDTSYPPPLTDTLMQARNLSQFYTSAIARQADPRGGYDHAFWYELTGYRDSHCGRITTQGFGLLDTCPNQPRLPHSWAMQQVGEQLTGKRCSGRVTDDDTAANNHVRMYEFEDVSGRRTWVCWKNADNRRGVGVKLPVHTNSLTAESLAYTGTPPVFSPRAKDDGWLSLTLNPRPVFISEKTAPQRPDLRVDSVRYVRASRVVRARVTNHGTRPTPVRSGSRVPYITWAVLMVNGDSQAQVVRTTSIAVNQQVVFTFDLGQTELPDTVLLSVTVNPNQTYVELGTDDNTGHALAVKP